MQEAFLHYVWQFQYFDGRNLETSQGEPIEIVKQGFLNTHSGPDFDNAKIRISGIEWVGCVEIHINSSQWFEHNHQTDPAYEQVVLHVVWRDDKPVYRSDRTLLPTLVLDGRVNAGLIGEYWKLVNNPTSIPCKKSFPEVDRVIKLSMLDKVLMERLELKASMALDRFKENNHDWRETAYQLLARNFGFKINSEPFLNLARILPYKLLLKHADQPMQVEALLFGQAGLLDVPVGDDYYRLLQREFGLLSAKYGISSRKLSKVQWRFLRMRPANFPTIRIAQFAALVTQQKQLFSKIFEAGNFYSFRKLFYANQSAYWRNHYQFNRTTEQIVAGLGDASVDNILINSVAPLLVAYGKYVDQQPLVDYAVQILHHVPSEVNSITRMWRDLGFTSNTSFDSQALIELFNGYCQKRNCLNCAIGASLLKPKL